MHTLVEKKPQYRWCLAILSVFLVLSLVLLWRIYRADTTLPDPPLTDEERRQMDIVLFNELYARDTGNDPLKWKRYEKLKAFADRGFKPAKFAIRLYDIEPKFGWRDLIFDWPTYWRIKLNAMSGDPAMNCLVATAIADFQITSDRDQLYKYLKRAVDGGQSSCTWSLSGLHRWGSSEIEKDLGRARELENEAARRGHVAAQVFLAHAYANGTNEREQNYGKALCWLERALESGLDAAKVARTSINIAIISSPPGGIRKQFPTYDPKSHCELPSSG